jgi:hypothetical protein
MHKQLVIVKDFENKPLLRKVCYSKEATVFLTSEKAFKEMESGNSSLFPIGFRSENVFIYEGQSLAGKMDWKKLRAWSDGK